jgi:hypothetical protein
VPLRNDTFYPADAAVVLKSTKKKRLVIIEFLGFVMR